MLLLPQLRSILFNRPRVQSYFILGLASTWTFDNCRLYAFPVPQSTAQLFVNNNTNRCFRFYGYEWLQTVFGLYV